MTGRRPLLREVPGLLSAEEIGATSESILKCQLPSGLILWFQGGHADPWNHVECAMALDVTGHRSAAERAYEFLAKNQLPGGGWHRYYTACGVEERVQDANCAAHISQGLWQHYLLGQDLGFLKAFWPVLKRAMGFVLNLQRPGGEVIWARHADGVPWTFALLASSSSIYSSLLAAVAIAETLERPCHKWRLGAERLKEAICLRPKAFSPRDRWAMDWYYPVLCGAVNGSQARRRMLEGAESFVIEGWGIRCVSDKNWVTPAETAEAAMAFLKTGMADEAFHLLKWSQRLRDSQGRYWTGITLPDKVHFPADEKATYSAAAQLLAAHLLVSADEHSEAAVVSGAGASA